MIHTQNIVCATRIMHPEVANHLSVRDEAGTVSDAFSAAVPEAACDVTFLFHGAQPASPVVLLQLLLRAFCTLQKTVSAVTLQEDRIEMQVEEALLVIGATKVAGPEAEGYFRPEGVDTRDCARLSLFLEDRNPALRLRVSPEMSAPLLDDIICLLMRLNTPKALLLTDSKIVLKRTEFESLNCGALALLRKGQRLAVLSKRFVRSRARAQSPVAASHFRSNTAAATLRAQTVRAECTVTSFCDNKKNAAIARAFRETYASDIHADAEDDTSLCDAIILKTTHSRVRVLAPLMVATMVLFNSAALVAAASQYVPSGLLGQGSGPASAPTTWSGPDPAPYKAAAARAAWS